MIIINDNDNLPPPVPSPSSFPVASVTEDGNDLVKSHKPLKMMHMLISKQALIKPDSSGNLQWPG